ncbi:MAG: hypothetical protein HGA31_02660 [Candidatus Moranbacteria bacterium]|nr:hypothetical protein [Candidatus Moranbacteria bacterium]
MKAMMVSFMLMVALLFVGRPALANVDGVDLHGLTEAQKAQLVQQAEEMKAPKEGVTAQKVNEWVDLGKNVAIAFTSAAKELGIAADAFLNSNTGKLTAALIIWKVLGQDVLHFIIGGTLLVVLIPMWAHYFRRLCVVQTVKITYPEKGKGVRKIKEYVYMNGDDDTVQVIRWIMLVVLALVLVVGLAIMI